MVPGDAEEHPSLNFMGLFCHGRNKKGHGDVTNSGGGEMVLQRQEFAREAAAHRKTQDALESMQCKMLRMTEKASHYSKAASEAAMLKKEMLQKLGADVAKSQRSWFQEGSFPGEIDAGSIRSDSKQEHTVNEFQDPNPDESVDTREFQV